MIRKKIIVPHRVREVNGSFAFIPHRFMTEGFWKSLSVNELLLYFFLVMVADKNGLSYYGSRKICSLLDISSDEYIEARDVLIVRDLIAFDDIIFQVLELPATPVREVPAKYC